MATAMIAGLSCIIDFFGEFPFHHETGLELGHYSVSISSRNDYLALSVYGLFSGNMRILLSNPGISAARVLASCQPLGSVCGKTSLQLGIAIIQLAGKPQ